MEHFSAPLREFVQPNFNPPEQLQLIILKKEYLNNIIKELRILIDY